MLLPSKAREETKLNLLPPGHHTGLKLEAVAFPVNVVIGVAPDPSGFTTQILSVTLLFVVSLASLPSKARLDVKTIFVPSGDQGAGPAESA